RRRRPTAPDGAPRGRRRRAARNRGRAASGREEGYAGVVALRAREGSRRDLVPLRAVPRAAVPVLPPRRGRGGARRHEHRTLRRVAPALLRPNAVHRDHAPETNDGSGGHPVRRHHGRRRRVANRLEAAPARGAGRRCLVAGRSFSAKRTRDPSRRNSEAGWSRADAAHRRRRALTQELASAAFDPGDELAWERLEEALIRADVGVRATAELVRRLEARGEFGDLNAALSDEIGALFGEPPTLGVSEQPSVVLV